MVSKLFSKTIAILLIIISGLLIALGNFFPSSALREQFSTYENYGANIHILINSISLITAFLIMIWITKHKDGPNISQTKGKKIISYFAISYFIILIILNILFPISPAFDWGVLTGIEKMDINELSPDAINYLEKYPFQIGTLLYYSFWSNIIPLLSLNNFSLISQIGFTLSGVIIYYLANKKLNVRKSLMVAGIYYLWIPFIWYSQISYSDTLVIPYILGFLVIIFEKNFVITKNIKKIILASLLLLIGSVIKFPALIFGIAIIIILLYQKMWRKALVGMGLFILIVILNGQIINFGVNQYKVDKTKAFPTLHWLDMGTTIGDSYGGYNENVINRTAQNIEDNPNLTSTELNQFHINNITNNIKSRTFQENAQFYREKISYIWSDPYLYANEEPRYNDTKKDITDPIFNSPITYFVIKVLHNSIFLIILFIGFSGLKNGFKTEHLLLGLVLIGVFTFFLLWEARSRYIVMFWPFIVSFSYIFWLDTKRKSNKF
jgi:hypothetical protein